MKNTGRKVKWGILSTARIGTLQVIPAMQQGELTEVAAIASRSIDEAKMWADKLNIPKAYSSYEELLQDEEIEAIYNPLPNHLHVEWTIKSMQHGKHVLCEKPFALHSSDIRPVITLKEKTGLKVGEAFMVKTHPQWLKVKQLIEEGFIGKLELIHGFFSYFNNDPHNIRNIAAYGGGALWDIGCYPVMTSRFIFGEEPVNIKASMTYDATFNTDKIVSAILEFPSGKAVFSASTQLVPYQRMQFFGTEKMLEISIPFNAPVEQPAEIIIFKGDKFENTNEVITVPVCNQYTIQGDAFSKAIIDDGEEPVTLEETYRNTKVIEAMFRSARG
ncbi:MAG: Gfo/Idh/MocA family oxidoreductase [Bacteroidetes bacterium]|nr:Gfo/Idh/MocA family oxidoreductase [Bacteroidota bacterium]MCH8231829.1 Gfo/Idh/MocA family oxidoreductase [Bacteroidota bacterium]